VSSEILPSTGQLLIIGDFTEELLEQVSGQLLLMQYDYTHLNIFIHSAGGSLTVGFALYDLIRELTCTTSCIAMGELMSAATLPFLAGDHRYVFSNTRVMLHAGYFEELSGGLSVMKANMKELKKDNQTLINIYHHEIGHSKKKLRRDLKKDLFMNASQAIAYGLASDTFTKQNTL